MFSRLNPIIKNIRNCIRFAITIAGSCSTKTWSQMTDIEPNCPLRKSLPPHPNIHYSTVFKHFLGRILNLLDNGYSIVLKQRIKKCFFQCSGSGSGSFYRHAKIIRKTLKSYYFVILFDFLSLKNNVNVPSKSNKQKKLC